MSNDNEKLKHEIALALAAELMAKTPGVMCEVHGGVLTVTAVPEGCMFTLVDFGKLANVEFELRLGKAILTAEAFFDPPTPSQEAKLRELTGKAPEGLHLAGPPHMRDRDPGRFMKALGAPVTPEQLGDIRWDGQGFSSGDRLEPSALARKVLEAAEQDHRPTPWNTTPRHEDTAMQDDRQVERCKCGLFTRDTASGKFTGITHVAKYEDGLCSACGTTTILRPLVKYRPVGSTPCPDCAHLGDDAGFYVGMEERATCQTCDGDKWIHPEAPPATLPPEGTKFKTRVAPSADGSLRLEWPDGAKVGREHVEDLRTESESACREAFCPIDLGKPTMGPGTILVLMSILYPNSKLDAFLKIVTLDGTGYVATEAFGFMLTHGDIGRAGDEIPAKPAPRRSRVVAYKTSTSSRTYGLGGTDLKWPDGKMVSEEEMRELAKLSGHKRTEALCPINIHGKPLSTSFTLGLMEFLHPGAIILPAQQCIRLPNGMKYTVGKVFDIMKRDGVFGDSAP